MERLICLADGNTTGSEIEDYGAAKRLNRRIFLPAHLHEQKHCHSTARISSLVFGTFDTSEKINELRIDVYVISAKWICNHSGVDSETRPLKVGDFTALSEGRRSRVWSLGQPL